MQESQSTADTPVDEPNFGSWKPTVVFVIAFLLIGLFAIRPMYEGTYTYAGNSDDIRMTMITSGIGHAPPSEMMLYTNRLIGKVLVSLYEMNPGVSWYGIYLLLSYLIGLGAIVFAWGRVCPNSVSRAGVLLFAIGSGVHFWTHLQFTTMSAAVTVGGFSLLISALLDQRSDRGSKGSVVCGWLMIVLGTMIRWHAGGLVIVLIGPVALIVGWARRKSVSVAFHLLMGVLAVGSTLAIKHWDQSGYASDAAWRVFKEYDAPAASLTNNVRVTQTFLRPDSLTELSTANQEVLKSVGWSFNDMQVFLKWYHIDPEFPRTEHIVKLQETLLDGFKPSIRHYSMAIVRASTLVVMEREVLFSFALSILFVLAICPSRIGWGILVAFWTACILLEAHLIVTMKLPDHIYMTIGFCSVVSLLSLVTLVARRKESVESDPSHASKICLAGVLVFACVQVALAFQASRDADKYQKEFVSELQSIQNDDRFYIFTLPAPFHRISPLDSMTSIGKLKFVFLDGHQQSPRQQAIFRAQKIENPSRALIEDSSVRLIARPHQIDQLALFLAEHYHVDVEFVVDSKKKWFTVYRAVVAQSDAKRPAGK
jgi:hypothetical protein